MIAFGNNFMSTTKMELGGHLTDKGQIKEVEEPLRNPLAKDRPTVVLVITVSGVNSCGQAR